MTTAYTSTLVLMNATLIVSMAALRCGSGRWATSPSERWRRRSPWPAAEQYRRWWARSVTSIFENIGTVQDGMRSIDVKRQMPDPPDAVELQVTRR